MNYSWQTFPSRGTNFVDSASTISPLSGTKRLQDVIPSGTVASRVHFLQSLAAIPPVKSTALDSHRTFGDSRTGFGRRRTTRFGSPASRKTMPDDEEIETSHSFLGLSTPRTNHEEIHAMSDGRMSVAYRDSPVHREKTRAHAKSDASQTRAAPKSRNSTTTRRSKHVRDLPALHEVTLRSSHNSRLAQVSALPRTTIQSSEAQDLQHRIPKSQHSDTVNSDASFATASTIRRQSVRDLFRDYGIERPSGFASSKDSSRDLDETPRPQPSSIVCHACSWRNHTDRAKCWRCDHLFCAYCNVSASPAHLEVSREQQKPKRPYPTPIQVSNKPHELKGSTRKLSSPPTKFPCFNLAAPRKHSMNTDETSKQLPLRQWLTTGVKDSPFLIADASSQPLQLSHTWYGVGKYRQNSLPSRASLSEAGNCDSPGCRATHNGHQPYRHSIYCSRRESSARRNEVNPSSQVEEHDNSKSPIDTSRPPFRPSHPTSHEPQATSSARNAHNLEVSSECPVAEYVECRGYPRTGHGLHGSPTSTGIIGECQHCLDDCQCAGCQNTHHSVRCCVHQDHRPMIHHHHVPRTVTRAINPLEKIRGLARPFHRSRQDPPHTVVPPLTAHQLSRPVVRLGSLRRPEQKSQNGGAQKQGLHLSGVKDVLAIEALPVSPLAPMMDITSSSIMPINEPNEAFTGSLVDDSLAEHRGQSQDRFQERSHVSMKGTWSSLSVRYLMEYDHCQDESRAFTSRLRSASSGTVMLKEIMPPGMRDATDSFSKSLDKPNSVLDQQAKNTQTEVVGTIEARGTSTPEVARIERQLTVQPDELRDNQQHTPTGSESDKDNQICLGLNEGSTNLCQEGSSGLDVQSITVVIHMRNREDLVFKIDTWQGGQQRIP